MPRPEQPREPRDEWPQDDQDLLRTADVAAIFQVSTRTVSEWARRGRIPCMRTPGGQWRYPADAIRRLLQSTERRAWDELDRLDAPIDDDPT